MIEWWPLLRHADHTGWSQFHGKPRQALWQRIAAEILLRAYEELAGTGVVEPLRRWSMVRPERSCTVMFGNSVLTILVMCQATGNGCLKHWRVPRIFHIVTRSCRKSAPERSAVQAGPFAVEGPLRHQVLHGHGIIAGAQVHRRIICRGALRRRFLL